MATEDGSVGNKGKRHGCGSCKWTGSGYYLCLRTDADVGAIRQYAIEHDIPAYISLEERMACGVGACLGCVCKTTHKDAHSHVNNARICTDGPVFEAREVEI